MWLSLLFAKIALVSVTFAAPLGQQRGNLETYATPAYIVSTRHSMRLARWLTPDIQTPSSPL
jgi:hypothetical protein